MQKLMEFTTHLQSNPSFQYGTIRIYRHAIKELTGKYGDNPSIDQLNAFILAKCNKRQAHVKYAIQHYLRFLGREKDYDGLIQAKVRAPIRDKQFLSRDQLRDIVDAIGNKRHQAIATIQISTGARASEIISIEKRRVRKEEFEEGNINPHRIKITIKGKGDKPRAIYLAMDTWPIIEPFYNEKRKYLFLEDDVDALPQNQIETRINSMYKNYYNELQKAALSCGIKIATHDLRRSVAELLDNVRLAQLVLGHSDIRTTTRYLNNDQEKVAGALLSYQKGL